MSSTIRKTRSVLVMAAQLALAAPPVIAHRTLRLAMASPVLSQRDKQEFRLMGNEKTEAFSESWRSMASEAARINFAFTCSVLRSFMLPSLKGKASPLALVAQLQIGALDVLGKGLAPVHRGAVANAKRLAGTSLR